jgi:hypothetical protein
MEPKGKRLHTLGHRETKPLIVGQVAAISLQPEYPAMLLLGVDHFSLKKPLRRVFIPQKSDHCLQAGLYTVAAPH